MKKIIFIVVFLISSCSLNSQKENNELSSIDKIDYYSLLQEYYKNLLQSFESEGNDESIKILKNDIYMFNSKISKNCNSDCVVKKSQIEINKIINEYYNFNSLLNNKIYPLNNDIKCYENKALFYFDLNKKILNVEEKCGNSKIYFNILDFEKLDKIDPSSLFFQLNGDANKDGVIDQKFIFKIAGKNKWYILTNGRSVYSYGTSNVDEIKIGNIYYVD
ncbi:hypothetical protein [Acinetobacter terrestris]|uniref:hypothetical protein n=1 Tax=Acinetobacter terrestris TaxID=2529843 RepID=UPI00103B3680|nr:hypothetical protein [Acinetobacter terrestris]TCB50824.1 hypothetical protein E0H84_14700 [Acinetobacter terrestris]